MRSKIRWVPFDAKGNLIEYASLSKAEADNAIMRREIALAQRNPEFYRPNEVFETPLRFTGFSFGRSACRAVMVDREGHEFPMFISEFEKLLLRHGLPEGCEIVAKWTFAKMGANYGLALAE